MSDIRKVWPKEALTATNVGQVRTDGRPPYVWTVSSPSVFGYDVPRFTEAEFAAAFVDAAVLTELIDAARALDDSDPMTVIHQNARAALHKALAAFDAVMLPDTETQ